MCLSAAPLMAGRKVKKPTQNTKSIRVSLLGSGLCFTKLQCSQALSPGVCSLDAIFAVLLAKCF